MNIQPLVSDGKIFTVIFIKRTTGERRVMRARRGVVKYLRGGDLPYDPSDKGLMTVFDIEKNAYRTVPLENIIELHHHGKKEIFNVKNAASNS